VQALFTPVQRFGVAVQRHFFAMHILAVVVPPLDKPIPPRNLAVHALGPAMRTLDRAIQQMF